MKRPAPDPLTGPVYGDAMRCGVSEVTRSSKELEALQEKMQGEEKKAGSGQEALGLLHHRD